MTGSSRLNGAGLSGAELAFGVALAALFTVWIVVAICATWNTRGRP